MASFDDSYGRATARFYDSAYSAQGQVGPDAEFYRSLAIETGGPVLELGCGTGRVLLPIAQEGLACTGLDLAPDMLAALRAKDPPENLDLVCSSMHDFDLGDRRFALVYSAFRAFQHLYSVEEQLGCLACVRRHLAPGGVLAFDVFYPRLERLAVAEEPEEEDLRFHQDGEEIVRYTHVTRDYAFQLLDVRMRYERRREGEVVANEISRFHMRWFHRYELEHLLARAGFGEVEIYGDFDRGPLHEDSPALVVIAR
jgi:SAM-dependent methyltransferase